MPAASPSTRANPVMLTTAIAAPSAHAAGMAGTGPAVRLARNLFCRWGRRRRGIGRHRLGLGCRGAVQVGGDVAVLLDEGLGEDMAARAVGDEIEIVAVLGADRVPQRCLAGI